MAAGGTDIGRGRQHNEDNVLVRTDLQLYVLADGAGGHNAGNVASALATTSVANHFEETEALAASAPDIDAFGLFVGARRLAAAIQEANRDVIEIANTSNRRRGMGTTIVALHAQPHTALLHLGHVGDSRCYRLRDGHLELLTSDHSLLNDVLEFRPDMDDASLARLPRSVVTRALGMEEPVRVSIRTLTMLPGDRYLLCSDGLTDALEESAIGDALHTSRIPDEQVRLLIDLALNGNGQDNIAALVVACDAAAAPAAHPRRQIVVSPRVSAPPAPDNADGGNSDGPEIMFADKPGESDADSSGSIHVVPAESASDEVLDALDGFVGPGRPRD